MKDNHADTVGPTVDKNKERHRINILMVEDNPDHATLAKVALEKNKTWSIDVVGNLATAFAALKTEDYDVLLVDYCLPDGDGLDLLDWIEPTCAVIVMTSQGSEQLAVEALKYGAFDYVVKDTLFRDVIADVVTGALERRRPDGHPNRPHPDTGQSPDDSRSRTDRPGANAVTGQVADRNVLCGHHVRSIREMTLSLLNDGAGPLSQCQRQTLQNILGHCQALDNLLTYK